MTTVIFNIAKKFVPKISQTEKIALTCGTVGFDREIFSGKPNFKKLLKYKPKLSPKEEEFINFNTNNICKKINDYSIMKNSNIPIKNMNMLKNNGIFGMLIPENMGGLDFSTHARSQIVQKISSRSGAVGVVAMVPNSLGPGELLLKYGTESQKNVFLPKLSKGELIPCFGLTSWAAGSDAAGSMIDEGIVKKINNKLVLNINANKRYITLAPIANLIGLAIKVSDPDKLLKNGQEGITLLIMEKDKFEKINIGDRHNPLGSAFPNGTIEINNMNVPIDCVIGGEEKCGEGWKMLMECLSEGRAVSLPSTAVAASKVSTLGSLAYSNIRKQFKTEISQMEGVQEKLAEMIKETFIITSGQFLTNSILDNGEKPSVISAVLKQQSTERARKVVNHGMDIMGGSAICMGPRNILASSYIQTPIGITVEGSNTLTRSLIIFGQGLMRSHPYLFDIVESVNNNNSANFNKFLRNMVFDSTKNTIKSIVPQNLSNSNLGELERLSRSFSLASNMMLLLGKKFKTMEMLSGRFSDIFSDLYLAYSVMWYYEKYCSKNERILLEYCLNDLFFNIQENFFEIAENYPNKIVSNYILMVSFPYGRRYKKNTDLSKKEISNMILTSDFLLNFLKENIYIPNEKETLGKLVFALDKIKKNDLEGIEELRKDICQVDKFKEL